MAKNGVKGWKNVFRLIDIIIDMIFFSINWKNYFDRSIVVISMTVLVITYQGKDMLPKISTEVYAPVSLSEQAGEFLPRKNPS